MVERNSATAIGGFRSQPERCNNAGPLCRYARPLSQRVELCGGSHVERKNRPVSVELDQPDKSLVVVNLLLATMKRRIIGARSFSKLNRLIPNASFAERRNRPFCLRRPGSTRRWKKRPSTMPHKPLSRRRPYLRYPLFLLHRNEILIDVDVDRADLTSLPTIIEAH